jgi:hypothetical protein
MSGEAEEVQVLSDHYDLQVILSWIAECRINPWSRPGEQKGPAA